MLILHHQNVEIPEVSYNIYMKASYVKTDSIKKNGNFKTGLIT